MMWWHAVMLLCDHQGRQGVVEGEPRGSDCGLCGWALLIGHCWRGLGGW
jgi:hypothetical protein